MKQIEAKTVYVSGPMTGYEDFNRPLFNQVSRKLRAQGYSVMNPAEVEIVGGEWPDYMRVDVQLVTKADAIVVLPGWEKSDGATLELTIATKLGVPVYDLEGNRLELKVQISVEQVSELAS